MIAVSRLPRLTRLLAVELHRGLADLLAARHPQADLEAPHAEARARLLAQRPARGRLLGRLRAGRHQLVGAGVAGGGHARDAALVGRQAAAGDGHVDRRRVGGECMRPCQAAVRGQGCELRVCVLLVACVAEAARPAALEVAAVRADHEVAVVGAHRRDGEVPLGVLRRVPGHDRVGHRHRNERERLGRADHVEERAGDAAAAGAMLGEVAGDRDVRERRRGPVVADRDRPTAAAGPSAPERRCPPTSSSRP